MGLRSRCRCQLYPTTFQPSQRLLQEALRRRQSVLHVWIDKGQSEVEAFTAQVNVDWAFCSPLPGEALPGYVAWLPDRVVTLYRDPSAWRTERLRALVESHVFQFENRTYQITISLGVTDVTGDEWMTTREMIRHADENLHLAKKSGRNRVAG